MAGRPFALLIGAVLLSGCVSTASKDGSSLHGLGPVPAGKSQAPTSSPAGYFVALAASPAVPEAQRLHDILYDAVDAYSRKVAPDHEALERYVEAFEADGYTRLADDTSEIECDRDKCLVKLASKVLSTPAGQLGTLAEALTKALALKGLKPGLSGGVRTVRTYAVRSGSLGITCAQTGEGQGASYRCDFDLDGRPAGAKAASMAMNGVSGRGRLVSCALAPGVVRSANEARAEVGGGALLKLASGAGAGAKPVGFLRYTRNGKHVEFLDVYLCGDLSHDYFHIDGAAREPKGWLTSPARVGAASHDVEKIQQDEARLEATATVVEETPEHYMLEVRFHIVLADLGGPSGVEAYGDDRFYLRMPKPWLKG